MQVTTAEAGASAAARKTQYHRTSCKLKRIAQSFAIYAHRARPLLKTILTFLIKTCVPPLKLYLSNKGGAISGAVPAGDFTYFSSALMSVF